MSPHARLRAATAADHEAVDQAFAGFDIADSAGYRAFLRAHARALLPVERVIAANPPAALPWQPRGPLLRADLAALGNAVPVPLPVPSADEAAICGMVYVVEGSRLGGGFLAGRVAPGLPATYLNARHGRGEWRAFLAAFDQAADAGGEPWMQAATIGAHTAFALFARSAQEEAAHV